MYTFHVPLKTEQKLMSRRDKMTKINTFSENPSYFTDKGSFLEVHTKKSNTIFAT